MTAISLHMQRHLTSQSHSSVSQREQFFLLQIKLHSLDFKNVFTEKFVEKLAVLTQNNRY
jgi:hypothetical protein